MELYDLIKFSSGFNSFYSQFSDDELRRILNFYVGVYYGQNSGTGEGISKKRLRDLFFSLPEVFRSYFQQRPNSFLWRGDVDNPCDENIDYYMWYEYYLQSFGNKNAAEFFGSVIYPLQLLNHMVEVFQPFYGQN